MKSAHDNGSLSIRRRLAGLALAMALFLIGLFACVGAAQAQYLPGAGDGTNLWVVNSESGGLTILHRRANDEPGRLQLAAEVTGSVLPGGIAATNDQLWIIYSDLSVQTFEVNANDPLRRFQRYDPPRVSPNFPAKVRLLSFVAGDDGPWALVTSEQPQVLSAVDAMLPPSTQPQSVSDDGESDVGTPLASLKEPPPPPSTAPAPGTLRLIRLSRRAWVNVPLAPGISSLSVPPPATSASQPAQTLTVHLIPPRDAKSNPMLVTYEPLYADKGTRTRVALWKLDGADWSCQAAALEGEFKNPPSLVEDQIVLSRVSIDEGKRATVQLFVLRPDGVLPGSKLPLASARPEDWVLTPAENNALALVERGPKESLSWTVVDLRGKEWVSRSPLVVRQVNYLTDSTGWLLQMGSILLAAIMATIVWRRNPTDAAAPSLPTELVSADLIKRILAFSIDMAPGVAIAMALFKIDPSDIATNLFKQHASWEMVKPAILVVIIFVVHSCLSEIFTGRSLGKGMLGLRVVNYKGEAPNVGQVVIRNLLKAIEIVALIPTVLPLTQQYGQRLGDMVAKTIVAGPRPEDDDGDDDEYDEM